MECQAVQGTTKTSGMTQKTWHTGPLHNILPTFETLHSALCITHNAHFMLYRKLPVLWIIREGKDIKDFVEVVILIYDY